MWPPVLQEPWWALWPLRSPQFTLPGRESLPPFHLHLHSLPHPRRQRSVCLEGLSCLGEHQIFPSLQFCLFFICFTHLMDPSRFEYWASYLLFPARSVLCRWMELRMSCQMSWKMLAVMTVRCLNTHMHMHAHTDIRRKLILLRLALPSCQFALTPDFSCPLLSSDDSDCSSSSTASIALQSG